MRRKVTLLKWGALGLGDRRIEKHWIWGWEKFWELSAGSGCWGARGGPGCEGLRVSRSCDCLWHPPLLGIFNSDSKSRKHTHTRAHTQLLFIFFAAVRSMVLSLITSWPTCNVVLIPKDTAKFPLISVHLSMNICIHLTHWCIRFGQECWPKGGRDLILTETHFSSC